MRAIAKQMGIQVSGGVAGKMPYNDNQFDFALMVTSICFLDDINIVFKETYRIIKPEGCFIIGFVDKENPIGRSYQKNKSDNVFYRDARFYSVNDVVSYLINAGFGNFSFNQTIF